MEFDATFIIAAISFVIFVFVMNKIFYAPILKIMQDRQNFVEQNFINAENLKKEISKKTNIHDAKLEETRDTARNEIADKSKQFKDERAQTVMNYKNELYSNVISERENLKNSALAAKDILKNNIVDIARNISGKIMGNDYDVNSIDVSQIEDVQE